MGVKWDSRKQNEQQRLSKLWSYSLTSLYFNMTFNYNWRFYFEIKTSISPMFLLSIAERYIFQQCVVTELHQLHYSCTFADPLCWPLSTIRFISVYFPITLSPIPHASPVRGHV